MSFQMPEIMDSDVTSTLDAVRSSVMMSWGKFMRSEMSFEKLCSQRWFQIAMPVVLLVLSIFYMKPDWATTDNDDGTVSYNYVRIILISVTIYIIASIAVIGTKTVFAETR